MGIPLNQEFSATGTLFTLLRFRNQPWLRSVRPTLDLDDELVAEAKALAARERVSLTRLIEQGLPPAVASGRRGSPANGPRPPPCLGMGAGVG